MRKHVLIAGMLALAQAGMANAFSATQVADGSWSYFFENANSLVIASRSENIDLSGLTGINFRNDGILVTGSFLLSAGPFTNSAVQGNTITWQTGLMPAGSLYIHTGGSMNLDGSVLGFQAVTISADTFSHPATSKITVTPGGSLTLKGHEVIVGGSEIPFEPISVVPEPDMGIAMLLGTGLVAAALRRRRS